MFRSMSKLSQACAAGTLSLVLGAATVNVAPAQRYPNYPGYPTNPPAARGNTGGGRVKRADAASRPLDPEALSAFLENPATR